MNCTKKTARNVHRGCLWG